MVWTYFVFSVHLVSDVEYIDPCDFLKERALVV